MGTVVLFSDYIISKNWREVEQIKLIDGAEDHIMRIATLGCALCRHIGYAGTPAEIFFAKYLLRDKVPLEKRILPLCPEHHRGKSGFHILGRRRFETRYECNVESLLIQTISLAEQMRS